MTPSPGDASDGMQVGPEQTACFAPDPDGAYSSEKILERLTGARNHATKESNRFFVASLIFTALYLVKAAGLRADLVLLDQKVLEVPYGLFFFLIISQGALCLSHIRGADGRAYDRYVRYFCEQTWPTKAEIAHSTFPNDHLWLDPTSFVVRKQTGIPFGKLIFNLVTLATALVAWALYLAPILSGIYFLWDWETQIQSGDIDLQYHVVLVTTSLTAAWFINYVVVHVVTERINLSR